MSMENNTHSHENHRNRMRERFLKTGGKGFADHELLEMLLFFALPRINTNPLAHELINSFGGLGDMMCAPYDELLKVDGVGSNTAILIKLVSELQKRCQDSERAFEVADDYDRTGKYISLLFGNAATEKLLLMLLDAKNRVLHCEFVSEGTFSLTKLDFRKIVGLVMRKNAAKVIVAHNHPDGNPNPSVSDRAATTALENLLAQIGVELREHYIISDKVYIGLKYIAGQNNI